MSGHSHFRTILRRKTAEDQKRGQIFSKLARMISVAAKEGGDPEMNPKLRSALEEAKKFNLPKENIEKAIQRGTGKIPGLKLEEISLEGYGPAGIAVIIEGITDNKNRALAEIRQILQKYGGKLAESGSVKWLFEKKGVISVKGAEVKREDLELKAIEAEAEDLYWHKDEDILDIYTKPEQLDKIKKELSGQELKIESASLDWVAKDQVEVEEKDRKKIYQLFEELGENDAVQDIYSNLKV